VGNALIELRGSWLYTSFCNIHSVSRCFTPRELDSNSEGIV